MKTFFIAGITKKQFIHITLVTFVLTISSCATVFNSPTKQISINTTSPAKVIYNNDTLSTLDNQTTILVHRQKEPLKITVIGDSISKTITINSKNSFAYWLNAYPTPMFWTGFSIDKKNPKRYTFPDRVYVNTSDSSNNYLGNTKRYTFPNRAYVKKSDSPSNYLRFDPRDRKGQIFLNISLPWVNTFCLKPDNENYKSNVGFWGIALGLDYYHSKHQFLTLTASAVTDFFVPVPAAVDYRGSYEIMSSSYIALSNNHKIRNFYLGYGVSFAKNTWNLHYSGSQRDTLPIDKLPRKRSGNAIGFTFPVYYQLGKHFYAGVIYRPTILRFSTSPQFAYEHLISIDFGWKIRLKK